MSKLRKFSLKALWHSYVTLAILIAVFAILFTAARFITPIVENYRVDMETWASNLVHRPVQIGSISAGWRGFQPAINLNNVAVLNKPNGDVLFFLKNFEASISIARSLIERRLIIDRLYANGLKMVIIQKADKTWYVKGLQLGSAAQPQAEDITERFGPVIQWILYQPSIELQNINLVLMPYNQRTMNFSDIDLTITNDGEQHYLRGQAKIGDSKQSPINLAVNLHGSADNLDGLKAEFYAQGTNLRLDNWLTQNEYYGFKNISGQASFKLWAGWINNQITNVQFNIDLAHLHLTPLKVDEVLVVNQLQMAGNWQRQTTNAWQLLVNATKVQIQNQDAPPFFAGIWVDPAANNLAVNITNFKLQNADFLMSYASFIPKSIQTAWQATRPQGAIEQLQLQASEPNFAHYHVLLKASDLGMQPYQKIPGFKGIGIDANVTETQGVLKLSSNHGALAYEQLFPQAFSLDKLTGTLQWQQSAQALTVQAYNMQLQTPQIALQTDFNLALPKGGQPYLSLLAQFQENNLGKVQQFFPAKIMAPSLMTWFNQAFVGGVGVNGRVVMLGSMDRYPFIHNEGQYLAQLDINQLDLHYAPGWPIIQKLSALVVFHKNSMLLTSTQGQLSGNNIKNIVASIPNFAAPKGPQLLVSAQVELPEMSKTKDFVSDSPLKTTVGATLKPLDFKGSGLLDLKLDIPLHGGPVKTNGKITVTDLQLAIPDWRLNFEHLKGQFFFTENDFYSSPMTALFFGKPTKFSVKTLNEHNLRTTRINMNSTLELTDLKKYFNLQKLDFMQGSAPIAATVDINSNNQTHIGVRTDLRGMTINLPAPYNKPADKAHLFQLTADFNNEDPPLIKMNYQGLLSTTLAFSKKPTGIELARGQIHLGSGNYQLQNEPGLYVTGYINSFDWHDWEAFYNTYWSAPNQTGGESLIKKVDVSLGQLLGFKQRLAGVHLVVNRQPTLWQININSDKIIGNINVGDNLQQQGIQAQLSKLQLDSFGAQNNTKSLDPAKLIPLKIDAADFMFMGKDFGTINLELTPIKNGIKITKLDINNSNYQLTTQGQWLRSEGKDYSSFNGNLTTNDLGNLLSSEAFTDHLNGGKGYANFNLFWPDSPNNFQTVDLEGSIDTEFKDGTLVGLDAATNEKIGFGKLINALSFSSIMQRISLNFKDKDGFYFSDAKGKMAIKNGMLTTNSFYIDGPVAEIYISGLIGIKAQTYNLNMKIYPYFTSSLPIIAAVAINPLVGAATWAASKVVRYGIEKAIVYEYHIGGTWKDPIIVNPNQAGPAPVSNAKASVTEANPTTMQLAKPNSSHADAAPIVSAQASPG